MRKGGGGQNGQRNYIYIRANLELAEACRPALAAGLRAAAAAGSMRRAALIDRAPPRLPRHRAEQAARPSRGPATPRAAHGAHRPLDRQPHPCGGHSHSDQLSVSGPGSRPGPGSGRTWKWLHQERLYLDWSFSACEEALPPAAKP